MKRPKGEEFTLERRFILVMNDDGFAVLIYELDTAPGPERWFQHYMWSPLAGIRKSFQATDAPPDDIPGLAYEAARFFAKNQVTT